jgi:hypothetical protein
MMCDHAPVPRRHITADDVAGLLGLRHTARDALLAIQPKTVLEALRIPWVARRTTRHLLAAGLLTDPEGVQSRSRAEVDRERCP